LIVLDTHIWLWWVDGSDKLSVAQRSAIKAAEATGITVNAISLWEVAIKTAAGKLQLSTDLLVWLQQASAYPGIQIAQLSPEILVESTRLPDFLHRDPADRIIIATARTLDCPLLTADQKILDYPHVRCIA
jgi:PIN domain nuclease of toxin-antitoxin system